MTDPPGSPPDRGRPTVDDPDDRPTDGAPSSPGARRPGGRTARVRAQVIAAVCAELGDHGFEGLTPEGVAARAGVHRTTVYRRWRDVGGLLADVLDAAGEDDWQPPDTGSLRGDLTALNAEIQESLVARPSVAAALIAASFRSEQAARAQQRLWEDRYTRCEAVVERAVRRGELPPDTDARRLLVASTAPLYHQLVLLRAAPDPRLPEQAAATATLAAAAGAFARP